MRTLPVAAFVLPLLAACEPPPPVQAGRAVVEVYMHPNGLSNCVDEDGERWKADASCCPEGFEVAGFSAPAAYEFEPTIEDEDKKGGTKRRIFRHVVCLESK